MAKFEHRKSGRETEAFTFEDMQAEAARAAKIAAAAANGIEPDDKSLDDFVPFTDSPGITFRVNDQNITRESDMAFHVPTDHGIMILDRWSMLLAYEPGKLDVWPKAIFDERYEAAA